MTIQIPLSCHAEKQLREHARAAGKDLESYVLETLEDKLSDLDDSAAMGRGAVISTEQWVTEYQLWAAN